MDIWNFTETDSFITEIARSLSIGKSVFIYYPYSYDKLFVERLYNKIFDRDRWYNYSENNVWSDYDPIDFVYEFYFPEYSDLRTVPNLIESFNEYQIIYLDFSILSEVEIKAWSSFINEYTKLCHHKEDDQRIVFCVLIKHYYNCELIDRGTVSNLYFYNYLRKIDFRFLICSSLQNNNDLSNLEKDLVEELLIEIAFPNIDLFFYLMDQPRKIIYEPEDVLREYSDKLGINEVLIKKIKTELGFPKPSIKNIDNKHRLFQLWISGLISIVDSAIEIPSYLCCFDREWRDELNNKIWHAQIKIIFPVIEEKRIWILRYFQKTLKNQLNEYARKAKIELATNESIMEIEFFALHKITNLISATYIKDISKLIKLTFLMWKIRNDLAHLRTIKKEYLEEFFLQISIVNNFASRCNN